MREAVTIDPKYIKAWLTRARMINRRRRDKQGNAKANGKLTLLYVVENYVRALEIDPEDIEAKSSFKKIAFSLMKHFTRATRIEGWKTRIFSDWKSHLDYIKVLEDNPNNAEARDCLDRYLRENPDTFLARRIEDFFKRERRAFSLD